MNAQHIAKTIGVDKAIVEELMSGRVTISISGEFGATKSALQDFIHGRVRESVSIILGINKNDAQKMRDEIDRDQAIGMILEYCMRKHSHRNEQWPVELT